MQNLDQNQNNIAQGTPIPPFQQNRDMAVYQMDPPLILKCDLLPQNQNITSISPNPVIVRCINCNQVITSVVTAKSGSGTYTWCILLCIFTGCFCIPFFIDGCKDKIHSCPKCQSVLGMYEYNLC